MANKKAFIVGINKYLDRGNDLRGCVNDAENIYHALIDLYKFNPDNIRVLTDKRATKSAILERLNWLVKDNQPGDDLVFHYSAHGSQIRDREGDELEDGLDEILCVDGESVINTNIGLITALELYNRLNNNEPILAKVGNEFFNIVSTNKSIKDKGVIIKTKSGMCSIFGEEHPIAVFDNNDVSFIKAKNLEAGQCLLNSYGLFDSQIDTIKADDTWYIIGLFIGDGYFNSNKSIRFAYTKYTEDWNRELTEYNIVDKSLKITKNKRGDTISLLTSPTLCNILKNMGFMPYHKKTGVMPNIILPMDPSCIKGFLQGIFDAEGSSSGKSNTIIITMKDLNIINRIKISLDLFGIKSSITTNIKGYHTLTIHSSHANKFNKIIGFRFKDKNKIYLVDNRRKNSGVVGNIDATNIINLLNKWNFKKSEISSYIGINKRNHIRINNKKFTEHQFIKLVELISNRYNKLLQPNTNRLEIGASANNISKVISENLWTTISKFRRKDYSSLYKYIELQKDELKNVICNSTTILKDFILDKIIDKQIIEQDRIMYDFTVDKKHMFECNNLLVHNCPTDLDWDNPLKDDDLATIFKQVVDGVNLTMICDACHSATMNRELLPPGCGCEKDNHVYKKPRFIPPPFDIACRSVGRDLSVHVIGSKGAIEEPQRHVLISGCRDDQTSADAYINRKYQGALTWALTSLVRTTPNITWNQVIEIVRNELSKNGYSQIPQLSGNDENLNRPVFGYNN